LQFAIRQPRRRLRRLRADDNGREHNQGTRTWLDTAQHPHSDALKLTIRMTRPDFDHLNWDVTIEDSKYYQKPIKNTRTFVLMEKGTELYEHSCAENNRCEGGKCVAADVHK